MAIIDTKRDVVVVRIVYDGPPLSGKTTSIYALAKILGQQQSIFSPENSLEKTLYFDWLEYIGGFFKGYGISCQIITVPGQLSFEDRRRFLLQSADAVIFVLDAHVNEQNIALTYFQDLQEILASCSEDAAIKVVIQANKQDQEQVLSSEQLKDNFENHKIIESTATLGQGVREAFVVAVRFAVERTEELMAKGKLQMGEPDIVSGEQLLTSLQQSTAHSKAAETTLEEEADEDVEATEVTRSVDSSDEEAIIIDPDEENQEIISTESTLETDKVIQPIEPEEVTESLEVHNEADDELLKATAETPETLLVPEAKETRLKTPVDFEETTEIAEMTAVTETSPPETLIAPEAEDTLVDTLEDLDKTDEIVTEEAVSTVTPEKSDDMENQETVLSSESTDDNIKSEPTELLEDLGEYVPKETLTITTSNSTEPIEEEEALIFSDEPPASAEELAHEFALSETLERKDLPQRPQKDISAQWLWPPLAGQHLLKAVCKPNFKLSFQEEDELWCFQVDKKWYGFSKLEWYYPQVTQAREAFRAQISLHLQCSLLLSQQRGIVVVQEPQQNWRLWQLVKHEHSLAAGLTQALQAKTGEQLAQELFRYAVYYTIALQKSCHCASQLVFNLDNFALEAEQPVYLGLLEPLVIMDEQLSLKATAGLIKVLKQALRQHIHPWLAQLNIHELITQLERIEGFEQQNILEGLIQLFDELSD